MISDDSKSATVFYHLPLDDDSSTVPNVFQIPNNEYGNELRLKDIKEKFPLPGTYHFRFKLR